MPTTPAPPVASEWTSKKTQEDVTTALLPSAFGASATRDYGRFPVMTTKVAGLFALCALIWTWVLQAEASQALQASEKFNKPFFIVCFNHTAAIVLLPIMGIYFKFFGTTVDRYETPWYDLMTMLSRHSELPMRSMWRIAAFLSIFYCVSDYFWYTALATVSVAAGTAIFNCSPLFVYCFSICFLGERVSLKKVYGVLTAFVGVTLVLMYQDNENQLDVAAVATVESASFLAGTLVVIAAALYGAYEVAYKVVVGDELTDTATILLLTGLSGLLTIPVWIVGSLTLAFSPFDALYEPLGWPSTSTGMGMLFLSGSLAVLFNATMPLSLSWTSPLETSVGCMLTIPLSGVVDTIFHHTKFSMECIAGSILVMLGFGILEYASRSHKDVEELPREPEEEESRASQYSSQA
ncbi:hypothetical protein Poli38472_011549 [Pythium oligandrum]|uniref:EamA domain-containing protein n=1 Tax=Pythium oligandrum TaxID=41045 RepID=A0A8K1CKD2_PYTOL|nr:hypothetical protein Poli38472_011549 [Pythium oligandrum]|eukprot:TMW64669.1 hypothetical protein Poli38472_011549 [Pythium oligandrum]